MRRKDRECNDPAFFADVFSKAEVLFLALNGSEYPYCIPVNFAVKDSKIYIHSALEGHKLDLLARDGRVGFSAAIDIEIDTAKSTTYYKSVSGVGDARVVKAETEKRLALDMLAERYNALCKRPAPQAAITRTAIIRIDIQGISGKRNLPAPA